MSNPAIESSDIEVTPDYQAVIDAIERRDPYIFVSGKAGTGKTTLIGYLRETISGNVVVVAPTGVAALQVKGVTIHSFFRLPPRLIFPEEDIKPLRDKRLYKDIRLLIIDEISMEDAPTGAKQMWMPFERAARPLPGPLPPQPAHACYLGTRGSWPPWRHQPRTRAACFAPPAAPFPAARFLFLSPACLVSPAEPGCVAAAPLPCPRSAQDAGAGARGPAYSASRR
jgi:hypothetical protein